MKYLENNEDFQDLMIFKEFNNIENEEDLKKFVRTLIDYYEMDVQHLLEECYNLSDDDELYYKKLDNFLTYILHHIDNKFNK